MIRIFSFAASCAGKSSRTARFSDMLAEAFREKAQSEGETVEYECMTGADFRIDYCRSCTCCFIKGTCPLDEIDDCAELKRKMLECDILFFGTPVYMWQMSGIAKSVIDRTGYWTHRLELLGKPCLAFSTTDISHGSEVSKELATILRFTGAVVVDGGALTRNGSVIDLSETAEKLMEIYRKPSSGVSFFQQNAFLSRVIMARKYFKVYKEDSDELVDEMRVFRERKLDRYVLLKEAIEDLCEKRDAPKTEQQV